MEPLHSKGDELIQKALSDFSEDIPLEIQKGAVSKIKLSLQSNKGEDETLPSVIQRGVTPNPKGSIGQSQDDVPDTIYGLEELTARGIEEMKAGILTPKSEIGSEKKGLSQEHISKYIIFQYLN